MKIPLSYFPVFCSKRSSTPIVFEPPAFLMCLTLTLSKISKKWTSGNDTCKNNISKRSWYCLHFWNYYHITKGSTVQQLVKLWNVPKMSNNIGIHPQAIISNFQPSKTNKNKLINDEMQKKQVRLVVLLKHGAAPQFAVPVLEDDFDCLC